MIKQNNNGKDSDIPGKNSNSLIPGKTGASPDPADATDDTGSPVLRKDNKSFPLKSRLLKSSADLPDEQFEILCIAATERDLSPSQLEEVEGYTNSDKKRAEILSLYKKLHLKPAATIYPDKKKLLKPDPVTRVRRLVLFTLSVAASVAALVIVITFSYKRLSTGQQIVYIADTVSQNHSIISADTEVLLPEQNNFTKSLVAGRPAGIAKDELPVYPACNRPGPAEKENSHGQPSSQTVVPVYGSPAPVRIALEKTVTVLAEMQEVADVPQLMRLTLKDRFFMAFREKILGQSVPDISPLKGWEITSAGITGINRLLNWEMALEISGQEYGEDRTLEFNSKLVKVRTPVKKNITDQ